MAQFEIVMPKMGESIEEATITKWFVKEGDTVSEDDVLLEIATDKVDSEIPSPVEGTIKKIMYQQDETVAVGSVIAVIDLDGSGSDEPAKQDESSTETKIEKPAENKKSEAEEVPKELNTAAAENEFNFAGDRFYSPLVRKIAKDENISQSELESITGSGINGRVQKKDMLEFLENRGKSTPKKEELKPKATTETQAGEAPKTEHFPVSVAGEDEIIQMDRMRKIIANHMVQSIKVSAHVTNMIEVDVTNIVNWRNKVKNEFQKREGQKITYLPLFMEAAIKGLKDFPKINSSVDGDNIIIKKRINFGVAVALPDNNLIVPVIKNADMLNVAGLTKELNRLADNARNNKLKPDDIQDGTFTVTNFGSFGNTMGTPIINQPQVAILAVGAIVKKPAVLETPQGDVIAIRHKMFLSLTYDHRIIDGALGGSYLKRVAEYIENFDVTRNV
jgi:2-oxoglutarate dehydrogenase E2 component (dihydrolipoamide succinyltransferase)